MTCQIRARSKVDLSSIIKKYIKKQIFKFLYLILKQNFFGPRIFESYETIFRTEQYLRIRGFSVAKLIFLNTENVDAYGLPSYRANGTSSRNRCSQTESKVAAAFSQSLAPCRRVIAANVYSAVYTGQTYPA